jgi:hypothetical protein
MRLRLEIRLGNDAMLTLADALGAISVAFTRPWFTEVLKPGEEGVLHDVNGNRVGSWVVVDDA